MRFPTILERIVPDAAVIRELKALYRYTCQVCQEPLNRGFGDHLVEGYHVQLLDGVAIADHTVVVAVGITAEGRKKVLGLWEGATENAVVCKALPADLI